MEIGGYIQFPLVIINIKSIISLRFWRSLSHQVLWFMLHITKMGTQIRPNFADRPIWDQSKSKDLCTAGIKISSTFFFTCFFICDKAFTRLFCTIVLSFVRQNLLLLRVCNKTFVCYFHYKDFLCLRQSFYICRDKEVSLFLFMYYQ